MINRKAIQGIGEFRGIFPVIGIVGPRQCGKTTLAQQYLRDLKGDSVYLDLERPSDRFKLEHPEEFLGRQPGMICLDAVQRVPHLFEVLRSECDRNGDVDRFLVLGSASPELLKQSSETLAGRIGYIYLTPLLLGEVGAENWRNVWLRGGFPRSYLAGNDRASFIWREQFIATFLERDLPQLGIRVASTTMRRFWEMCAHLHGELWNASKVAGAMGVTAKTINHYLDILEGAYVMRILRPYTANLKKRLVKTPKVYIRDSGLLHGLLRIQTYNEMMGHPVWGASWEGFCIEQILSCASGWSPSFYRTAAGAELDLVLEQGMRKLAFEFKASRAPKVSKGFWSALDDVQPERAIIVAPVEKAFPFSGNVSVAPLHDAMALVAG